MAKREKKIDPKAVAKSEVMGIVGGALASSGLEILDGAEFGMTQGTLIVRTPVCDVQIKPITPKSGVDRYEKEEE